MLWLLHALFAAAPAVLTPPAPEERGVALGLFSEDASFDYRPLVDEIAGTGATHVEIAWVWWQDDIAATEIKSLPRWSPTEAQIKGAIRAARVHGLHVTAFPILRLVRAGPSEWRGKIAPSDEDRWWASYEQAVLGAAELARAAGAQRLSIGSELVTREPMRARWLRLIEKTRLVAPDLELLYSANWDHYAPVSFWDAVDVVGLTAYFELTTRYDATEESLHDAWGPVRAKLERFSEGLGRPLVITEIGYPSIDGGAAWPWDQTRTSTVDLEEQRRAYSAFVRAWSGSRILRGVYWWNWFGFGGPDDKDYTPRKKPAAEVLRRWYQR